MTNEEALKWHRISYQAFIDTMWDGNEDNNPFDEAFIKAISALEKQNKYRWHDLLKDPEDLPENGDYIICAYESILTAPTLYELGEYTSFGKVFPNIDEYDMDYWFVRAWREIEPFEEGE